MTKRADEITNNLEAKRPKMDVPPPNCLRTRRPGGRVGASDAESRLGSMSGRFPDDDAGVNTLTREKTASEPADQIQKSESQTSASKATSTRPTKLKAIIKPPKQLLNEYYAKLQIKSIKDHYTTIVHDKVVKFASAFTCPSTGETFIGGRVKSAEYIEEIGVVWYRKSLFSYNLFEFSSNYKCHSVSSISIEQINYHFAKPTSNWQPQLQQQEQWTASHFV